MSVIYTLEDKDGKKHTVGPLQSFVGYKNDVVEALARLPAGTEIIWTTISEQEFMSTMTRDSTGSGDSA